MLKYLANRKGQPCRSPPYNFCVSRLKIYHIRGMDFLIRVKSITLLAGETGATDFISVPV